MRTEDGYIIHKCLNGDKAAFGLLVDKYKGSIYALAYTKLRNFHDAEDVTQEVFTKAYQKLRTLRRWDSFLAWLYSITSNLCKEWIQSQAKRPDREFLADQYPAIADNSSMERYRENSLHELLHDALDALPDIYRQVLTLYYLGGMNTTEISRFLGVSPNTAVQRLNRARSKLRGEMITMMSRTYKERRLRADFTFRIVEMVERIKIQALPHTSRLPWGISTLTGIIIAALSFTSPQIPSGSIHASSVQQTASVPNHSLSSPGDIVPIDLPHRPQKEVGSIISTLPMRTAQTTMEIDKDIANESGDTAAESENTPDTLPENSVIPNGPSPEDEQLALSLLNEAWELTEGKGYYARLSLLGEIAKVDSKMALELAETIDDATELDSALTLIIYARLRIDPEDALPLLARIQNVETKAKVLAASARSMAQVSPEKARRLLLEALDLLEEITYPQGRLYAALPAAIAARDLGMDQTQQQLVGIAREAARASGSDGLLRYAATQIAIVDPDVALSLVNEIQDINSKYQAWANVITEMTRIDVHTAQDSLSLLRSLAEPDSHIGENSWARAAKNVAIKLAESDVQAALKLARQIPEKQPAKGIALARIGAKMATQDKQEALRVFDEAIASAHTIEDGGYPSRWVELARIGLTGRKLRYDAISS